MNVGFADWCSSPMKNTKNIWLFILMKHKNSMKLLIAEEITLENPLCLLPSNGFNLASPNNDNPFDFLLQ